MIREDNADNFYYTAPSHYLHLRKKIENKNTNKNDKTYKAISLAEAEEIISLLISQYIEEKVHPHIET